jgi:hypothetical protein
VDEVRKPPLGGFFYSLVMRVSDPVTAVRPRCLLLCDFGFGTLRSPPRFARLPLHLALPVEKKLCLRIA